ncbi:MAG: YdcF family protein, partial [Lachnospiraceae bacterium]|nr:YdcF family protein [Lachnospiraceae bacterium]
MLSVTFGILSVLCLIYFCVIVVYSGIETSAVGIWLALAVLFFLLSRGSVYYSRHKNKVPLWLPVSAVTLCALGLTVFLILQFFIFSGMMRASSRQPLDYLIVLGAKVREDDISSSLKRRLDKVIRYVEEHPETKLVLSGGQGPGEPTTEAQAMAEYLRYNGVAPEQMLLEMSSTSTKENMICSKALIEDQKRQEKEKAEKEQRKAGERRMELDLFIRKTEKLAAGQSVSGQPFTTQPPSAVQQMP